MQVQVERVAVGPLLRHHDDQSPTPHPPQFRDGGVDVAHVVRDIADANARVTRTRFGIEDDGYRGSMVEHSKEQLDDAEERLKRLEKEIDKARDDADEAVEGSFHDEPGDRFVESGNEQAKCEDDQTIAPG
jgi:hypothetical protein